MKRGSVYLLPNITNLESSIETRAQSMSKRLERLMGKIGAERCHLVTHSFAGVDARAAISMNNAPVASLTTLSSPHLGMRLI